MTRKSEQKPDDLEQSKRFLEAAKKAEVDEKEAGADRAFKRVSEKQQQPSPKSKSRS